MNWTRLESIDQIKEIIDISSNKTVLIYKHSTRCSISRMVLDRLERNWNKDEAKDIAPFFLDLISYRDISGIIAERFKVQHESPQVLIIKNGESIYDVSHNAIDYQDIVAVLKS